MTLYFAYGANLNLASMSQRCPLARPLLPYYLSDWRLAFSGVATIQPDLSQQVPGALWSITDTCEASLDIFEGYPDLYTKHYVDTEHGRVMFYRMNSDPLAPPGSGYLRTIAEGYQDWNLDFDYLDQAVAQSQIAYCDTI